MVKRFFVVVVFALLAAGASVHSAFSMGATADDQSGRGSTTPTPDRPDYRKAMLERAESEAGGVSAGMRAWVLLQIARIYEQSDRAKALELLEGALAATRGIDEDRSNSQRDEALAKLMTGRSNMSFRSRLQEQILRLMVSVAPERADELLGQVDAKSRAAVLTALLARYETNRQTSQEIRLIERIAAEDEMPYDAAIRVMGGLKDNRSGQLQELFIRSLASYRDHSPHDGTGTDAFPAMVVKFWSRVPRQVARDAVDEILKQAEGSKASGGTTSVTFSFISPGKGEAAFNSLYKYRLFQLLPVIREIDESAAKDYLQKYPELAEQTKEYPKGDESLFGGNPEKAAENRDPKLSFSLRGSSGDFAGAMLEIPQAQKFVSDAEAGKGAEAIDNAGSIRNVSVRAQCYEQIARVTFKKQPSVAGRSIEKMLDTAENLELVAQLHYYLAASDMYVQLGDNSSAKETIQKGLALADKLYRKDSNPDDPNKAVKVFWPSTNAYSRLVWKAAQISPHWALTLLGEIDDREIRVAAEAAIASALFKIQPEQSTIITSNKNHNSISTEP